MQYNETAKGMKVLCQSVLLTLLVAVSAHGGPISRDIVVCEPVSVRTPAGTVPRLPYRLWVTHADGSGEYRLVRWTGEALQNEQARADTALYPAGSEYEVKGYIVGDDSTAMGFPVTAHVSVCADGYPVPSALPVAEPLPLDKVSIDGINRLTHNRDLDIDQLLSLDVRQQLYNYRDTYGLPLEDCPEPDGWDSPTTKLKGHGSGHYMSALALAYASCTDARKKAKLKANIRTMVDELRRCQERTFVFDKSLGRYREARDLAPEDELPDLKGTWTDFDRYKQDYEHYGYGYLGAIPPQHCVLVEMYRAYNNEQWVWAPYYSVHKQLAGLIDIATYMDDKAIAAKALRIARDMGLWVWNRLHYRTYVSTDGTQAERRARPGNRYEMWNMYIAGEVGGMAESLARLSEMTDDSEDAARLLEAASCFDSPAFFTPLARNIDVVRTRHANQHIPMVTGALRSFRSNANPYYYNLAENFWTMVQGRYRYATGGVGNGEMFRQPYTQILSMCTNVGTDWRDRSLHPEPTLNETCCAYNLAKLTKELNCFRPNDARYMDYYERVLCNQIVGSLRPDRYAVVYQYAVGLDASKPWGNETPQSTCCGGTGAENHLKYQEAAYFVGADTLWTALYMPTTARWEAKGAVIRQECEWPAQESLITFPRCRKPFAVKLRVPYWATQDFDVKLNGCSIASRFTPGSYVTLPARRWRKNDTIRVSMPFSVHVDFGPDKMEVAATDGSETGAHFEPAWCGALMNGPLVMAAQGIKTWEEATIGMEALEQPSLMDSLRLIPDYASDSHVTHYFRFLPQGGLAHETGDNTIDDSRLQEAITQAQSRVEAQEAWNALEVKVPEYAPWAKHGYARLTEQLERARALSHAAGSNRTQSGIDAMASELNATLNTMRPGNLPELEDLDALLPLLQKARQQSMPDERLREAIRYAEMVVRYVSDGSGTHDMIERAVRQLQPD